MRNKIVLIDDNDIPRKELGEALNNAILDSREYVVEPWLKDQLIQMHSDHKSDDGGHSNAMEDVFQRIFDARDDIALVVVDHDLSGLNLSISKSAIVAGCSAALIPVCTYHRAPSTTSAVGNLKHIRAQQHSYSIQINLSDLEDAASIVLNIAGGFAELEEKVAALINEGSTRGPADFIARITGRTDQAPYFLQYMESATLFSDILEFADDNGGLEQARLAQKLSLVLGYWLYSYVLVFPGILLNRIAAASYLDLGQDSFTGNHEAFSTAEYRGPFSVAGEYWWRYDLDDLLIGKDVDSGFELLQLTGIAAERSLCFVSNESPAGYYCIAHKKPVSIESSKGNIGWIPSGADLCRIDISTFDKLSPLLGL